jgi:hypothetical protein
MSKRCRRARQGTSHLSAALRLAGLVLGAIFLAIPSSAERPFRTDDPYTVGLYRWESFGGLAVGSGSWDGVGNRSQVDFSAGFDYGLTEFSEVGISGILFQVNDPGSEGFGDGWLHYKHHLVEAYAESPDIGLDISLRLPTASRSRGLGTGKSAVGIAGLFGWKSELWCTTFRLGLLAPVSSGEESRWEYGVATRYKVSEIAQFLGELYGDSKERPSSDSRRFVSAGVAFTLSTQTTLDALISAGLSNSVPDLGFTVGLRSRL